MSSDADDSADKSGESQQRQYQTDTPADRPACVFQRFRAQVRAGGTRSACRLREIVFQGRTSTGRAAGKDPGQGADRIGRGRNIVTRDPGRGAERFRNVGHALFRRNAILFAHTLRIPNQPADGRLTSASSTSMRPTFGSFSSTASVNRKAIASCRRAAFRQTPTGQRLIGDEIAQDDHDARRTERLSRWRPAREIRLPRSRRRGDERANQSRKMPLAAAGTKLGLDPVAHHRQPDAVAILHRRRRQQSSGLLARSALERPSEPKRKLAETSTISQSVSGPSSTYRRT